MDARYLLHFLSIEYLCNSFFVLFGNQVAKEELNLNDDRSDTGNSGELGPTVAIVIGSVVAALCLVVALFLIVKYRGHKKRRTELQLLVAHS